MEVVDAEEAEEAEALGGQHVHHSTSRSECCPTCHSLHKTQDRRHSFKER